MSLLRTSRLARSAPALPALLALVALARSAAADVAISVDNQKPHQTMEGFGASHTPLAYSNLDTLTTAQRKAAIDAIYNQVKLNTGNVEVGTTETPAGASDTWAQQANDDDDPNHFNWSGFNFSDSDRSKTLIIDLAQPLGFKDFYLWDTVSVRWAMQWLKAKRAPSYTLYLDEAAEHVAATAIHWRDAYGISPRLLQLFNEPTSGNTELDPGSAQEVVDLVKRCGDRLRQEGFADVKLVVPGEETEFSSLATAQAICADPGAAKYVGAIAYHVYPYGSTYSSIPNILATSAAGNPLPAMVQARADLRDLAKQCGNVPLFMTEVSHGYVDPRSFDSLRGRAVHIHDELQYADAAAYFGMNNMWDTTAQQGHFGNGNIWGGDSEGNIVFIDNATSKVTIAGIGYAIGHYARWINRGAVRLETTSSQGLVQVSAFRDDAAGRFVAVVINNDTAPATLHVAINALALGGPVTGEQSVDQSYWAPIPSFMPSSVSGFDATVPPLSVTTFAAPLLGSSSSASSGGVGGGAGSTTGPSSGSAGVGSSASSSGLASGGAGGGSASSGVASGGAGGAGGGGATSPGKKSGGCGCGVAGEGDPRALAGWIALGVIALAGLRRAKHA